MKNVFWMGSLVASALLLVGCERADDTNSETSTVPSSGNETLSATIGEADGLSTVAELIGEADLASVFDGASAYTILAPTDEAFETLGGSATQLTPDGDTAPMIALLRNHIVTGHLRPADLRTALAADDDGEVRMASVGSDFVTFAMDGDAIVARGTDGSQVRLLVERAVEANNGVVIPVDGLLRKLPATSTARR